MSNAVEVVRIERARRLLAIGAWAMLGWVVIGFVTTIPAVDNALANFEETALATPVITLVFLFLGATGVVLWYAALRLAILTEQRSSGRRFALIAGLVLGNFVAAFLFYFTYVLWHSSGELARTEGHLNEVPSVNVGTTNETEGS